MMTKLTREEEGDVVKKCGMARLGCAMRYHGLDERSRR